MLDRLILWHHHPMLQDAVREWLRGRFDHGLTLEAARSPEDMVRRAAQGAPSLVLVDIDAPQGLGFALLRTLEELPTAPALLAMTVYDDDTLRADALAAGADGCICLLHANANLREAIGALLHPPRPLDPSPA